MSVRGFYIHSRSSEKRNVLHKVLPLDTPYNMSIYVGDICNFKCHYCIQSRLSENKSQESMLIKHFISEEMFEKIVNQICEFPQKIKDIKITSLGEATLHPNIVEMINYIHERNICDTVHLVTNGSLLNPNFINALIATGIERIDISLQGYNSNMYKKNSAYDLDFDEFLSNLHYLYKHKKQCFIYMQTLTSCLEDKNQNLEKDNYINFYETFSSCCDQLYVDKTVDIWRHKWIDVDMEKDSQIQNSINDICSHAFYSMHILANGNIIPCCAGDRGYGLAYGNVNDMTLYEAFHSKKYYDFLVGFLEHRKSSMPICQSCYEPNRITYQEDILMGHEEYLIQKYTQKI